MSDDEVTVREFVELAGSIDLLTVKMDVFILTNKAEHDAITAAMERGAQDALKIKLALLGSGTSIVLVIVTGVLALL